MTVSLLLGVALAGYAVTWVLQLRFFTDTDPAHHDRSATVGWVAVSAHLGALLLHSLNRGTLPLAGFGPAAATLTLMSVLVLFGVRRRIEGGPTGLFALPPIIALLGAAVLGGMGPAQRSTGFDGAPFVAHVATVLAGQAILLLASVAAAMYLLQFRALKHKEFGNVFRSFPSLETLDRMSGIALVCGLAALTIGLAVGWSFTFQIGRGLALADPPVVFGVLTWAVYAAAVALRLTPGGRGERAAAATVLAFFLSAASFVVLRAITTTPEMFL